MVKYRHDPTLLCLRRLVRRHEVGGQTDGQLLERFAQVRDEAAFAALVDRHGPLVFGVCRRVLGHLQDAEDAFQATFLVLARRAAALDKRGSVANWLHTVAYRLALRTKAENAQRAARQKEASHMVPGESRPHDPWHELRQVLDEEVQRLPDKYRAPVVLCYLQGKTHAEAARELGWPTGTVSGRLARARETLRYRLMRRGVVLSSGLLVTLLAEQPIWAAVPAPLAASTARAALAFVAGQSALGAASARVITLALGALNTISAVHLKIGMVCTLMFGLTVTGLGAAFLRSAPPQPPPPTLQDSGVPKGARADALPGGGQGDRLPPNAVGRLGTTRLRHGSRVTSVAFSPDGKWLASGGEDWRVALWDTRSGKQLRHFGGLGGWVRAVAVSPDGNVLAAAGGRQGPVIALWKTATGGMVHQLKGHEKDIHTVAFSPDGKLLASGGADQVVRLWGPATGKGVGRPLPQGGAVHQVVFSPDGKWLAAGGAEQGVLVWDVRTGKQVRKLNAGPCFAVAYSPDGKLLATGGREVVLWDAATGNRIRSIRSPSRAEGALAFTPDGRTLVAGGPGGAIHLFEVATGNQVRQYQAHADQVRGVVVSADGKVIASAGNDNCVHLADAATGKELLPQGGHTHQVMDVVYFPDGRRIATAGRDNTILVWDAARYTALRRLQGHKKGVGHIAVSADSRTLVSAGEDDTIRVWDVAAGKELRTIAAPDIGAQAVALSPDGKHILSGGWNGGVRLWETATGRVVRSWKFAAPAVAYAPDGATFAATDEQQVVVWNSATGKELWRHKPEARLLAIAYAPDGRSLAAGGEKGSVHVWEAWTGTQRCAFTVKAVPALFVAFSPAGRLLAVGGGGGAVHLRDALTGREIHSLSGHIGWVRAAAFSPDGKRLASGSGATESLVWDVSRFDQRTVVELKPGDVRSLWNDLAEGRDGAKVHGAIARLSTSPRQAVLLLQEHLQPAKPLGDDQKKRIARLILQLDADRFQEREDATAELEKMGARAAPLLRTALEATPSLEARTRLRRLLEKADASGPTDDGLRTRRALEVLERLDTPEARQLVGRLAKGDPAAWLTQEAQRMQQRMSRLNPK